MTVKYQIIYWRDIPAQVKIRGQNRQRLSRPLPERFSVAIDEAAMRAGLTGSEDYLAQWHTGEWQEAAGEPDEVAEALVARLVDEYPTERLRRIMQRHGLEDGEE